MNETYSMAKSTHPIPFAGVCHALQSGETPVCVGPGAGTGVVGPKSAVVVGVTMPPIGRQICSQVDLPR